MTDKLLPCPFCGGPAKTFRNNGTGQATCVAEYAECAGSDVAAPIAMWNRRLAYEAAKAAPGEAAPTGWKLVPVEPTDGLLRSMAVRYDHGLGVPGYYDQPIFGAENVGHAKRLEATIRTIRQLHEEVVGTGFYRSPAPPPDATAAGGVRHPGPNKQLDRVRIGDGDYVRADEAIKTIMELQRQLYDADRRFPALVPAAGGVDAVREALLTKAREYLAGSNPLHTSGGHKNVDLRDEIDAALASPAPSETGGEPCLVPPHHADRCTCSQCLSSAPASGGEDE